MYAPAPKRAGPPTRHVRKAGRCPLRSAAIPWMGFISRCSVRARKTAIPRFHRGNAVPTARVVWTVRRKTSREPGKLSIPVPMRSERISGGAGIPRAPDPRPDGSKDTRADWSEQSTQPSSAVVSAARRSKLRIVRFRASVKAHSLRCSSSPNHKRFAGLRFGLGTTKGTHNSRCGICTDHAQNLIRDRHQGWTRERP